MKRKPQSWFIQYVLLANGEEYPRQWTVTASTPELARQMLLANKNEVGTCEVIIINISLYTHTL